VSEARTTAVPGGTSTAHGRRVLAASSVGSFVEWFDFTVYGFTASVLASVFFPPDKQVAALLATFAIYAVAFFARPLGAVVFGWIGDRRGRRPALASSILLMGTATLLIGVLPGYATIGALAPALLLVLRVLQGISGGGEFAGALTYTLEHAPDGKRGRWLGIVAGVTLLSTAAGTALVVSLRAANEEWFVGGGWRVAFIVGGLLAMVGLYLRSRLDETPAFRESEEKTASETEGAVGAAPVHPFRETVRRHGRTLVVQFAYFTAVGVATHILIGYVPTYLTTVVGMPSVQALVITTGALLLGVVVTLTVGRLSDRVGRRRPLLTVVAWAIVTTVPAYLLLTTGQGTAVAIGLAALAISVGGYQGCMLAMVELFPARVRYSGVGIPYNVSYAVFAGTAPLVSQALVGATGSMIAPAVYVTAITVLAAPILFRLLPETRGADLVAGVDSPVDDRLEPPASRVEAS
jgi:MFS transporter, MHS family, proline/betaine transporter